MNLLVLTQLVGTLLGADANTPTLASALHRDVQTLARDGHRIVRLSVKESARHVTATITFHDGKRSEDVLLLFNADGALRSFQRRPSTSGVFYHAPARGDELLRLLVALPVDGIELGCSSYMLVAGSRAYPLMPFGRGSKRPLLARPKETNAGGDL